MKFKGSIDTAKDWVFVDKFCVNENGASMKIMVNWGDSNKTAGGESLWLYSDKDSNWGQLYNSLSGKNNDLTCFDKRAFASYRIDHGGLENGDFKILPFTQNRDRYWYISFGNCNGQGINLYYEIEITNDGDRFDSVISADQQSIPQAHIFFVLYFFVLLVGCVISVIKLKRDGLESKVFAVLSIVLAVKLISLFLYLANWNAVIVHGFSVRGLEFGGQFVNLVSVSLWIMLLLLISQGWTISVYYGSVINKAITAVVVLALTAGSWAIYTMFAYYSRSYMLYVYFWDTIPGYILLAFFITIMVYFLACLHRSYNKNNDDLKKRFFILFGIIFTCWFISLPIVVVVAHFMDSWYRYKVIACLNLVIDALWYLALIVVFFPYKSNPYLQIINTDNSSNDKAVQLHEQKNEMSGAEN
ncbi:hypothetical protein DLAC_10028 [Tieghemostelium lacteum]|uniref:Uncharacterized protein n=1 Tax=Tieghemostelium lacteum TaxID=361077 RepID=A0A151Z5Z1_TIELA|nr:hypothetical protein DLAC_10028 [Tieghemostelium lacteum]|eukprot:KYQ89365.1 hypothetical protein DLAC_10028 [Tieghemostelium lacteum]